MKNYSTTHTSISALILTGILSVGSSLTLLNNAIAAPTSLLPATASITTENNKTNSLPHSVKKAVLRNVSHIKHIRISKLTIAESSQQTWRNGCLDLPKPNELCTEALIPGWLVVVSDGSQNWTYHTNSNGRSLRLANTNVSNLPQGGNTVKSVPMQKSELPPALDKDVIFRAIASGGFMGRTDETVLLNDGRLIQMRLGDTNDSNHRAHQISPQQLQQFQQLLAQQKFATLNNLSYPASKGTADYITYTLSSLEGTVRYDDISVNNLPENLRAVIQAWKSLN